MPRFTVTIHTPQELNHSSYIQTGLFELENQNLIKVKVKLSLSKNKGKTTVDYNGKVKNTHHPFPKASFYSLFDHTTQEKIVFVTDLYDHAEHFSLNGLTKADFYFKRSYEKKYVSFIEKQFQRKIYRLGITFGVHSKFHQHKYHFFVGFMLSNLYLNFKADRFILKRLLKTYFKQQKHWNFVKKTRLLERFENYNFPQQQSVFFQTRCFPSDEQIDVQEIHEQRYEIIKLLQRKFPKIFRGGFVPSKMVESKYTDAKTNVPTDPEAYLNSLKQAKIVIYTRGLANSPAWKMAEYMSQAKVIIAEKLTTDLPVPLTHGKELLFFENDDELVGNIKLVLENEQLAKQLSKNARAYFEKHIHPVETVKRVLETVIKEKL